MTVTGLVEEFKNLEMVCCARSDTVLYDLPGERTGKRGRPCIHGERLEVSSIVLDKHLTLWVENILMMVPLGILLYILWKPFRQIGWSMFAGALFSLLIECTQFIGRLGKFETDDRTLLGFLLCKGIVGYHV